MQQPSDPQRRSWLRHAPLAVILTVAIIGYFTLRDHITFETLRDNREALLAFRDANYAVMILAFIAVYVVIVAFSLPGAAVSSVTGGFLFGLVVGTAANVIAASLGAFAIFLAARWGLGETLAAKIETSEGRLKRLKAGLHENEISVLFLIRLVPAVPFFVANLLPALVGVRFFNFAITTVLGIVPGALVFTWIGVGLGEVFDLRGDRGIVKGKMADVGMVLVGTVLLVANIVLTSLISGAGHRVLGALGIRVGAVDALFGLGTAFLFLFLMYLMIYKFVPARRLPWRTAGLAALLAAVSFELLKFGFSWYLTNFADYQSVFFAFATIVVLVISLYYTSTLFVLSGEIAQLVEERRIMARQREVFD